MNVIRHDTAEKFLDRAGRQLEEAEAENNLILGIAGGLRAHPERYKGESCFMTLQDSAVIGAALMTPPHHLVIARVPEFALKALGDWLLKEGIPVPGVLGPKVEAKVFADYWTNKTGKALRPGLSQRIYACSSLIQPAYSHGQLRRATEDDRAMLLQWCRGFITETGVPESSDQCDDLILNKIADGFLYVWEHRQLVSMAGLAGETAHGIRVSLVYTPPVFRRNGYATSCVAALTQHVLDSGKRFCALYTDLANPTSNGIYQKIGYAPVCDCQDWLFD
jgi:predicted GNAT family acetyltransferase